MERGIIRCFGVCHAVQEQEDELDQRMEGLYRQTASEAGSLRHHLYRSVTDPWISLRKPWPISVPMSR
jgi:hypothetical protein